MKHTNATWQIEGFDIMSDDTVIASVNEMAELPFDEIQYNALLIAAAPDLLVALKRLMREYECLCMTKDGHVERWPEAAAQARDAIEQATKFPD